MPYKIQNKMYVLSGGLSSDRVAQYIKHCLEVAKLYGETAKRMTELKQIFLGK